MWTHGRTALDLPLRAVFMGMGEPLLNLPSVLRAHQALTRDLGIGERTFFRK